MNEPIEPRRRASSEEGAAIVSAIVQATALLLERDGYDALTTTAIANVAGVSIGSLYQYFPNKHAVVVALARDIERRGRTLALERATSIDPNDARQVTEAFVSVMLDPRLGSPAARRALLLEVPPAWILRATSDTDGSVERLLTDIIALLGSALREGPREIMSFVAFHAVEGVVEEALRQSPALLGEPAFHRELARLAWAYVAPRDADLTPREQGRPTQGQDRLTAVDPRLDREPTRRPQPGERRPAPRTARGRATVDAILDGMSRALREHGWQGASARKVARHAGLKPSSIYRYFPDLRAVVAELARRREARSREVLEPHLSGEHADTRRIAPAAIRALIADASADLPRRQVLLSEVPQRYILDVAESVDGTVRGWIRAKIAARSARRGTPPSPDLLSFVVAHGVERTIDAAVLRRPELLDQPALADELTTMILRYLGLA